MRRDFKGLTASQEAHGNEGWIGSQTSFWKTRQRSDAINRGVFVFHQFAASGYFVSRIATACTLSTAKPLVTDTRPRKSRPRKPRNVGGPSSTPDDRE
jgi:hypothetical protein